jgi:hypothetical protein
MNISYLEENTEKGWWARLDLNQEPTDSTSTFENY